jgi:hypothetical protein
MHANAGRPFLGKDQGSSRHYAFGHRDRVDEAIDLARSVRDKQYLYIRNYMPHLGYNQPTAWPDLGEVRHEFYRLTDRGTMTDAQWHFAAPTRPIEELYDCQADPWNLVNLAGSKEHKQTLERLREAHGRHSFNDLGFIPETLAVELFGETAPWTVENEYCPNEGRDSDLCRTISAARWARRIVGRVSPQLIYDWLRLPTAGERYWAAVAAISLKKLPKWLVAKLESLLLNDSPCVCIAAADALARHGHLSKSTPALIQLLDHDDLTVVLHAARTIELLGPVAGTAVPAMRKLLDRAKRLRPSDTPATFVQSGDQDLAMFASFAAREFLKHVEEVPRRAPGTR